MRIILSIVIISCLCVYIASNSAYAAETVKASAEPVQAKTAVPQTKKAATPTKMKDLTKEEMVTRLKKMIEDHPDLLSEIRGLTAKEIDGKKSYEYNGKKLEDLDKAAALNLLRAASRFISFQNTQRLERQMRSIKQAENMSILQRQIKLPQPPPQPPAPPPSVPKTYTSTQVYAPPKTYKVPSK